MNYSDRFPALFLLFKKKEKEKVYRMKSFLTMLVGVAMFCVPVNAQYVIDSFAVDASMIGLLGKSPKPNSPLVLTHPGCTNCGPKATMDVGYYDAFQQEWFNVSGYPYQATFLWNNLNYTEKSEQFTSISHGDIGLNFAVAGASGECEETSGQTEPPFTCYESEACTYFVRMAIAVPGNGDFRISEDNGVTWTVVEGEAGSVFNRNVSSSLITSCNGIEGSTYWEVLIQEKNPITGQFLDSMRFRIRGWCDKCEALPEVTDPVEPPGGGN